MTYIDIVWLAVLIASIILLIKVKSKVSPGSVSQEPLTKGEKAIVWVCCLLNPILVGAVFYYGWKKRLPVKANQANQISMWAFVITFVVVIALATIVSN